MTVRIFSVVFLVEERNNLVRTDQSILIDFFFKELTVHN